MTAAEVLALAREHAAAEAVLDVDRTLATLVDDPVFEFYPSRTAIRGRTAIERFYREQYGQFASQVVDVELFGEWANESAAIQEYQLDVRAGSGTERYRVLSMMPARDGKLAGERLYCDDGFLRVLLGDLFELREPIA